MTDATWEFEAADPEVGFLTDTVTHTCDANLDDPDPAVEAGRTLTSQPDGKTVTERILFWCPACGATTTATETWPASMFEEER